MEPVRKLRVRLSDKGRGQTMTEYVLILAVLALICFGNSEAIGETVHSVITGIAALL
ncbi:MAG: Flp family type IVb pilin [Candidatus Binataceae bacterium]